MISLNFSGDICLSGGADGADLQFGMCAGKAGHSVYHFSFDGHRTSAPSQEVVILSKDQLLEADPFVGQANKTLKRRFPTSSAYANNLLRRNYFQTAWSSSVYAVSTLKNGRVEGGTAWAVQMFIDRFGGNACAAYVYCQQTDRWYTWCGEWVSIDQPPVPSGIWAGIGTRELKDSGKNAIRSLLSYLKETT